MQPKEDSGNTAGLCTCCVHASRVPHPHGGADYVRCRYSGIDARYPKYPRLPVLQCMAFKHSDPDPGI